MKIRDGSMEREENGRRKISEVRERQT